MILQPIKASDIHLLVKYRIAYLIELQGDNIKNKNWQSPKTEQYLEQELYKYFKKALEEESVFAFMAILEEGESEQEGEVASFGAMVIKKIPGDFDQPIYLEGDILNMYTVPSHRKKGISTLILKSLIEEAKKRGISKIALHTTKAGEKLYRKEGFQEPIYPVLELPL